MCHRDVKPDNIVYDWVLGVGAEKVYTFFMLAHDAHPVTLVILVLERPSPPVNSGNTVLAPAPWKESLLESDPDCSWYGASEV
jgi:hypothetical protein